MTPGLARMGNVVLIAGVVLWWPTLIYYNVTGRWWPLVVYLILYAGAAAALLCAKHFGREG